MRTRPIPPLSEYQVDEFWKLVDRTADGCWAWRGYFHEGRGTNLFRVGRTSFNAHRIAYFLVRREQPPILQRSCSMLSCVNPDHHDIRAFNRARRKPSQASRYRGVMVGQSQSETWWASLRLGPFTTAEEAAEAYDQASLAFYGDRALTNRKLGLLPP